MIDIKFIRDNPQIVQESAKNKGVDVDIDHVLEIDKKHKELSIAVQNLREERNKFTSKFKDKPTQEQLDKGRDLKNHLEKEEHALNAVTEELQRELYKIPNLPADDVPVGKDESGNKEIRKVGKVPHFSFEPKSHDGLSLNLDLLDSKRAVKIAGNRSYFLKNDLVFLEQAILNYGLESITAQGFTPMTVPWMVNKDALWGTGYFPWGEDDHYTTQDGQGLIGTSEVSLTAYHKDEVIDEKDLPVKLAGISPCFRREVGSYGKDTKGFVRVHQFNKIEQVVLSIADEEDSRKWHEKMLAFSEKILQDLELPYRVLLMCTGDMGAGQRKKYDIEVWFPSQNKYRETHSASYFNDFQSRRLNMKYKLKDGSKKFIFTLNNTVISTPRILAAILENYQNEDGSVEIPKVLQKFINKEKISLK